MGIWVALSWNQIVGLVFWRYENVMHANERLGRCRKVATTMGAQV